MRTLAYEPRPMTLRMLKSVREMRDSATGLVPCERRENKRTGREGGTGSGPSDNGQSEEWTTSLQWTHCSPPAYISTSKEGTTSEQWT